MAFIRRVLLGGGRATFIFAFSCCCIHFSLQLSKSGLHSYLIYSWIVLQVTSHWTGSTGKKKGRKWGKEKFSSARGNDYKDLNKELSEALTTEKEMPINFHIDFDNLPPLTTLAEVLLILFLLSLLEIISIFCYHIHKSFPLLIMHYLMCLINLQEGDVIAYRLIELSSTWTPELSSFRVYLYQNFNDCKSIDGPLWYVVNLFFYVRRLGEYCGVTLDPLKLCWCQFQDILLFPKRKMRMLLSFNRTLHFTWRMGNWRCSCYNTRSMPLFYLFFLYHIQ